MAKRVTNLVSVTVQVLSNGMPVELEVSDGWYIEVLPGSGIQAKHPVGSWVFFPLSQVVCVHYKSVEVLSWSEKLTSVTVSGVSRLLGGLRHLWTHPTSSICLSGVGTTQPATPLDTDSAYDQRPFQSTRSCSVLEQSTTETGTDSTTGEPTSAGRRKRRT